MLRGPFANPDDYPSRDTALAIVGALKAADDWITVANIVGIKGDSHGSKAQEIAHRCYLTYGYPELEPVALARWTAGAFERRPQHARSSSHTGTVEARQGLAGVTHPVRSPTPPPLTYGLNRRGN